MWKQILKWLLKFTLSQLGENLDAEAQKAINEYNRQRAETEKRRDDAEIELGRIEHERLALVAKRMKNSGEIEFLQTQIKVQDENIRRLQDEKNKKLADISNLSDDDLLRSEL